MFGSGITTDYSQTERVVFGFLKDRFSDPYPGLPLSKDIVENILNPEFVSQIFWFSTDISEGLYVDKSEILIVFKTFKINPSSVYLLVEMIYSFFKGLEVNITDIEVYNLGYDFRPNYYSSEEYRHLQFFSRQLKRVIDYLMLES